jgi:hypothetical protein
MSPYLLCALVIRLSYSFKLSPPVSDRINILGIDDNTQHRKEGKSSVLLNPNPYLNIKHYLGDCKEEFYQFLSSTKNASSMINYIIIYIIIDMFIMFANLFLRSSYVGGQIGTKEEYVFCIVIIMSRNVRTKSMQL